MVTLRRGYWRRSERALFLETLAESGDVVAAALAAGKSVLSAHRLREADSDFSGEWSLAERAAWDRIEAAAMAHILKTMAAGGKIDEKLTMAIWQRHEPKAHLLAARLPDRTRVKEARAAIAALASAMPPSWQPPH